MRIAIVNDMIMAVEAIRRVVAKAQKHEIAWIAYNGADAIEKCKKDTPDLILMDLIMPNVDGVQATKEIMEKTPCAIVLVTATVIGNSAKVFDAMGYGALDAVCTPIIGTSGNSNDENELIKKIEMIEKYIRRDVVDYKTKTTHQVYSSTNNLSLIAIGSSTGGPKALATILSQLSKDIDAAIVIIQHVDVQFATGLAEWLNEMTALDVRIAIEGVELKTGTVYIAGTNDHLILGQDYRLHYSDKPKDYPYRPSVDTFFHSISGIKNKKNIAVLLTGMGRDGAKGLLDLYQNGWHTIAQDEATSVVFGMPKAAIELKAASEILPLHKIADSINKTFR